MANNLTVTKNWDDGMAVTESQLDDIKTSYETFLNTTKLTSDNIQTGGLITANLADASVTSAKIATGAVTTAKIADGAVTQVKRAALGQQISSSSSTFSSSSTSYTDVTNLSVSITTTGRPVWVGLQSGDASSAGDLYIVASGSTTTISGFIKLVRDSTDIAIEFMSLVDPTSSSTIRLDVPPSSIWFVDAPSAGTYTYKAQVKCGSNTTMGCAHAKLIAYEL